jgi:hypothetical protein|tara:strand:- start:29 stop:661 length:633 start_codon:yes stop_codon:yes gene_type:complete
MYFSIIPNISYDEKPISYPFSESDFVTAKNFFRRYKINDDIFSNVVYFKKYTILEGERPDSVALKAYGDVFYDWVIFLTNNMVNAHYDWPRSNYEMYRILEEEFDDPYSEISHYEIKETIGQYQAGLHVDETFYNGQHKLNINGTVSLKNGNEIASPITVAEYYQEENEKKREIYLLKKEYLRSFVDDFRKQNLYEKSGNYISQRLKKTG